MDKIIPGSADVSILYHLDTAGLTIADLKLGYVRWNVGDGTSFTEVLSGALTALATITTAHTDNRAIYLDTDVTGGNQFILRADFPNAAFATGKDKVICTIFDDGNSVVSARIFDLKVDLSVPSAATIADAVWEEDVVDEHQLTNSAAFILSNLFKGQIKLLTGTASSTNNTVVLTSGETVDDIYNLSLITTHDDNPGQTRLIVDYVGSTKTITVFPDWTTNPATSNGVGTSLIILAAGVTPASLEFIKQTAITESTAGRNAGNWSTFYDNADNITTKVVDDVGGSASGIADAVWNEARAGHTTGGTFGEFTNSNLVRIEGNDLIDTLAITTMFENIISHVQGDATVAGNTFTFKKQDGTTTTYSYTTSGSGRT